MQATLHPKYWRFAAYNPCSLERQTRQVPRTQYSKHFDSEDDFWTNFDIPHGAGFGSNNDNNIEANSNGGDKGMNNLNTLEAQKSRDI